MSKCILILCSLDVLNQKNTGKSNQILSTTQQYLIAANFQACFALAHIVDTFSWRCQPHYPAFWNSFLQTRARGTNWCNNCKEWLFQKSQKKWQLENGETKTNLLQKERSSINEKDSLKVTCLYREPEIVFVPQMFVPENGQPWQRVGCLLFQASHAHALKRIIFSLQYRKEML